MVFLWVHLLGIHIFSEIHICNKKTNAECKICKKGFSERRLVSTTGWESKKQGAGTQKEVKGTRILVEEVEVLLVGG